MRRIQDSLRLHFETNMSQTQISHCVKVGRSTLQGYIQRFSNCNIKWEQAKELSEQQLEDLLYPNSNKSSNLSKRNKPLPNWNHIYKELKRPCVTLQILWEEYIEQYPGGLKRSQFCAHYSTWLKNHNFSMRQEHKGGQKCFVDYSGKKPAIIDKDTGEVKEVELFVMCWGASHYFYAEAQNSQKLEDWIMGHVRAFEFYGCVPHLLVPDNLKSAVQKACKYDPDTNRTYKELSEHYGFAVLPARPIKPKDKAKVENAVRIIQRWILARLRNRLFYSLFELNQAIFELVSVCNEKKFQRRPFSRYELFTDVDKPNALKLPQERFEYCSWYHPTVSPDFHIEIQKCYYSVPHEFYGKNLDVRVAKNSVEVYHGINRIAFHKESTVPYTYTTNITHLPQRHQRYSFWTLENIMKKAKEAGESTTELIDKIIKSKQHPLQGYRPAQGILRLADRYGKARLENASKRALQLGFYRVSQISDMLKNAREKPIDTKTKSVQNTLNIRGKQYYTKAQEI